MRSLTILAVKDARCNHPTPAGKSLLAVASSVTYYTPIRLRKLQDLKVWLHSPSLFPSTNRFYRRRARSSDGILASWVCGSARRRFRSPGLQQLPLGDIVGYPSVTILNSKKSSR